MGKESLPVRWRCQAAAARVTTAALAFLGSVALLIVLIGLLAWNPRKPARAFKKPLLVYCAAGVLPPVEAVARAYETISGVPIQLQPGPSQTLLANIEISRRGDLYLPADDSYITLARDKGLVAETVPLARMTVVLAVRKGNPKNLRSLDDLLGDGVALAQAGEAAAIGKLTREALQRAGRWEEFRKRVVVFKTTVTEVANDVKLGAVDAGFIWDAMRQQYAGLEIIPIAALTNVQAHVTVGVLRSSAQPDEALRFARHLGARDQGLIEFKRHGYDLAEP
jgi:molybdate transport system substrate-binding protein